jgi:hypothetical protein
MVWLVGVSIHAAHELLYAYRQAGDYQGCPEDPRAKRWWTILEISKSTAHDLMVIAADEKLRGVEHALLREVSPGTLPPEWTCLYELTTHTDEQFETGIKSGNLKWGSHSRAYILARGGRPKKPVPKRNVPMKEQYSRIA